MPFFTKKSASVLSDVILFSLFRTLKAHSTIVFPSHRLKSTVMSMLDQGPGHDVEAGADAQRQRAPGVRVPDAAPPGARRQEGAGRPHQGHPRAQPAGCFRRQRYPYQYPSPIPYGRVNPN